MFVSGVTILELHISMFCIATVSIVVQLVFSCMIAYALFSNPIEKTNGLFMYALIMMLLGWLGFFFGTYNDKTCKNYVKFLINDAE